MKVEQKGSVAIPPAMCRDFNMPRSAGWTFIEALEYHREISGPDSQASYLTEPLRVVPCDLALRWCLLIVSLLDNTADFVFLGDHTVKTGLEGLKTEGDGGGMGGPPAPLHAMQDGLEAEATKDKEKGGTQRREYLRNRSRRSNRPPRSHLGPRERAARHATRAAEIAEVEGLMAEGAAEVHHAAVATGITEEGPAATLGDGPVDLLCPDCMEDPARVQCELCKLNFCYDCASPCDTCLRHWCRARCFWSIAHIGTCRGATGRAKGGLASSSSSSCRAEREP